ncbi:MAG: RlmE family RNA methyltransferase [Zoogloeaceae bacterium]|jgi:23S rRNA (uridine2552-2'-O)-methyltransferase|nr:RlmE family RNA methyltransferase [Zoogloeaceae bacterium]
MSRTKTSKAWMREHVTDPYVRMARQEGWRSRSAFKLMEMDDRDRLLVPGAFVVDLGAAPGGWSQVAARRVGATGRVIALDLLEIQSIGGVEYIQGDFCAEETQARLTASLEGRNPHLVMSDMAPNLSGVALVDQARGMALAELALEFAAARLAAEGAFLVKVFQGREYAGYLAAMRQTFAHVAVRKPKASRDRSAELYLLGRGLKAAAFAP